MYPAPPSLRPSVKKYDGNIMDLLELSPKEISNTLKKFFNENKPSPTSKLKESLFLLLEKHSAIDNFNEENEPILEIIKGPKNKFIDQEIRIFLANNGFYNVKIKSSKSSYR